MKFKFGKLKPEFIVMGILITAIFLLVVPHILLYIYPYAVIYFNSIVSGVILNTILIWLLCEALYLILKASQSIINKNSNEEKDGEQ
ncbi:hypothetical protein [Anaerovorax odorimutans]|uniref:hypothetical protein n=1 Tax=Anaerovorax odorimutans TaxID=109327 RepID=UPI00041AA591|nr:hypothetical protein [Anaerovorax odorimutans]